MHNAHIVSLLHHFFTCDEYSERGYCACAKAPCPALAPTIWPPRVLPRGGHCLLIRPAVQQDSWEADRYQVEDPNSQPALPVQQLAGAAGHGISGFCHDSMCYLFRWWDCGFVLKEASARDLIYIGQCHWKICLKYSLEDWIYIKLKINTANRCSAAV